MAVGDIVPVPGVRFEETLASASPDLLREMIKGFAQRMMDAEVEQLSAGPGTGRSVRGPGELPQRLPAAGVGHPGRHGRAGDPEAAAGHLLPGVAAGAAPPGGAGAGHRGGHVLPAGCVDAAGGEAGRVAGRDEAVEVAGQRDGGGAG